MAGAARVRVVVVGAGLAGLASAWAACKAGARVTIVRGRAGASALSSGAWDFLPGMDAGDARAREALLDMRAPIAFEPSRVVTSAGLVRDAMARDVQILDLKKSPCIVPHVPAGSWDASAIAASIAEARAVDATLLRHRDEMRMPLADLAALHDDRTRRDWLVERLKEALAPIDRVGCVLLPPMLGIDPATYDAIARAVGVPVGEPLCDPGGPHALRFLRWRDATLSTLGVDVVEGRAMRVDDSKLDVELDDGGRRSIDHDRVVLASGGVAAGGILFGTKEHEPAGAFPDAALAPLRSSIEIVGADVLLHANGRAVDAAGSLFGPDADRLTLGDPPALVDVGFRADDAGRVLDRVGRPIDWLFVAGDALEGRPRTALMAVARGVHAGTNAAA